MMATTNLKTLLGGAVLALFLSVQASASNSQPDLQRHPSVSANIDEDEYNPGEGPKWSIAQEASKVAMGALLKLKIAEKEAKTALDLLNEETKNFEGDCDNISNATQDAGRIISKKQDRAIAKIRETSDESGLRRARETAESTHEDVQAYIRASFRLDLLKERRKGIEQLKRRVEQAQDEVRAAREASNTAASVAKQAEAAALSEGVDFKNAHLSARLDKAEAEARARWQVEGQQRAAASSPAAAEK